MKILVLHLVDNIHDSEVVLHHLERIAKIRAYELVMIEVFHFYVGDNLIKLFA